MTFQKPKCLKWKSGKVENFDGDIAVIDNDANRIAALKWLPVEDVWGIGRRYAAKLQALGCRTAYDFAIHHKDWVRMTFNNINIRNSCSC